MKKLNKNINDQTLERLKNLSYLYLRNLSISFMKKLLAILIFTCCLDSYCQELSARFVEVPDYVEFKGSIDNKYDITLHLYPSENFAFGKYSYDKYNEEISLKGTIVYVYGFINDK